MTHQLMTQLYKKVNIAYHFFSPLSHKIRKKAMTGFLKLAPYFTLLAQLTLSSHTHFTSFTFTN
jgi:hypothetical protein